MGLVVVAPLPVTDCRVDVFETVITPVLEVREISDPGYRVVTPKLPNSLSVSTGLQLTRTLQAYIFPLTYTHPPMPTPPATTSAPVAGVVLGAEFTMVNVPVPKLYATTAAATVVLVLMVNAYPLVVA